jgi:hypothetical protein
MIYFQIRGRFEPILWEVLRHLSRFDIDVYRVNPEYGDIELIKDNKTGKYKAISIIRF